MLGNTEQDSQDDQESPELLAAIDEADASSQMDDVTPEELIRKVKLWAKGISPS